MAAVLVADPCQVSVPNVCPLDAVSCAPLWKVIVELAADNVPLEEADVSRPPITVTADEPRVRFPPSQANVPVVKAIPFVSSAAEMLTSAPVSVCVKPLPVSLWVPP